MKLEQKKRGLNVDRVVIQYLLLITLALIWGSSFILMKKGLIYFDSTQVAALRLSVAMIVLLPIALRSLAILRTHLLPLFLVGLLGNTAPAFLFTLAQTEIPSSLSGMLNSLTSLFTLVLGVLLFRLRPLRSQVLGVLIALLGTLGLVGFTHLFELNRHARYALLVVVAASCYGMAVNIIKSRLQAIQPGQLTSLAFLLTAPFLLTYLVFFTDFLSRLSSEPRNWWGVAYISLLGTVGTALAVILFNRLIKSTTAVFATSVTYLIPVVAVAWGVLDGEAIALSQLGYLGLILGGIFLINLPPSWIRRQRRGGGAVETSIGSSNTKVDPSS